MLSRVFPAVGAFCAAAGAMVITLPAFASTVTPSFTAVISSTGGGGPLDLNGTVSGTSGLLEIGPTNVSLNSGTGSPLFAVANFTATSNSLTSGSSAVIMGSSMQIKNTSAQVLTLDITLVDTGFTAPTGGGLDVITHESVTWGNGDSANGNDSASSQSLVNGTAYALANEVLMSGGANTPTATASLTYLSSPYSLGNELSVKLNAGDTLAIKWTSTVESATLALQSIPEPANLLMLLVPGVVLALLPRAAAGRLAPARVQA